MTLARHGKVGRRQGEEDGVVMAKCYQHIAAAAGLFGLVGVFFQTTNLSNKSD